MNFLRNQPKGLRISLAEMMVAFVVVAIVCRWPTTLSLAAPAVALYLSTKVSGPTRQRWVPRYFYRLMLPICWLLAAWVSWHHPGDEYGLFIGSALPASWIMPFVSVSHPRDILPPVFAAAPVTMALGGWSLDRIRVRPLLLASMWACGVIVLVLWALWEYPSYQRAMSKNGSLTAYVSAAANLSLYLSAASSFMVTGLTRCIGTDLKGRCSGSAVTGNSVRGR